MPVPPQIRSEPENYAIGRDLRRRCLIERQREADQINRYFARLTCLYFGTIGGAAALKVVLLLAQFVHPYQR